LKFIQFILNGLPFLFQESLCQLCFTCSPRVINGEIVNTGRSLEHDAEIKVDAPASAGLVAGPAYAQIGGNGIEIDTSLNLQQARQTGKAVKLGRDQVAAIGPLNCYLVVVYAGTAGYAESVGKWVQVQQQGAVVKFRLKVVINAGEIQNSGLEIVLNVNPIKTSSGFRWDLAFNYAKNNSKVIELAPGIETYRIASNYPNNIEARPGEAYGNIIGYAFKKSPDGRRIVGPGGSYQRESELSILGNITPNWIGGLNNTFSFKGLSMNILIDFVQGGQLSS